MKKIILASLFAIASSITAVAQAVLPTSWSFTTTSFPTGWTTVGTAYYTASGFTPPALKFDSSGDLLTINFASDPGNVTYYLAGNSFSGGTFIVEESVDGSSWTTLHTHTSPPASTYTQYTDVPNSASRYIRFNYLNKVTGNIGLDDVNIDAGAAGPAQEINIKLGATTIINGGSASMSSPVATTTPVTFTVENLGTSTALNITGTSLSGPAASDFSISSAPSSITATSSASLVINFTPSVGGTRDAVLTITNDDADENPYIINLNGIGGSFASEPASQPTALVFSSVKSYRFTASFTPASTPNDGYIVLRRTGSAITDQPVDGVVYQRGDVIGNSSVVYSGTATSFSPLHIVAGTTYHFSIFSYNGSGATRNYYTASPLTGNVTTAATMMPAGYYSTISTASPSFVTDLHNKINPHIVQFYSNYGIKMISLFEARDTVGNQRVITCVYSGENKIYTEPWDFSSNNFSREHTYCHSWMPTEPATSLPEYSDYHHLFPTNQNDANAVRSNYPLGEVVNATYTYLGCKLGLDANGRTVFEPREAQKGDAARAMMYEAVCYNGVSGNNWAFPNPISTSIPYGQDQDVLKAWHYQDPPDAFEIARNDFIDSLQDNRNPFVDSVQYACYIDFTTMNKISSPLLPCNTVGVSENEKNNDLIMLAPNPSNGNFTLTYITDKAQNVDMKLFDIFGRLVYSSQAKVNNGYNPIQMSIEGLSKGIYTFELTTAKGRTTEKLVIH
jgi:endonuclease I